MDKIDSKISYDPEADVLRIELSENANIDYAKEIGNIVVHFSGENNPVYIEILEAKKFLKNTEQAFQESISAAS